MKQNRRRRRLNDDDDNDKRQQQDDQDKNDKPLRTTQERLTAEIGVGQCTGSS